MKLQYLGDSKDSFKWDYHDYLVSELNYRLFTVALMMTPDDGSNDGKSRPSLFPARKEIIEFCHDLRESRSIETIKDLPSRTGALYGVSLHKDSTYFDNENRSEYFSGFSKRDHQLVFLDPDNGFEPRKSCSEKHVKYEDIASILAQLSSESTISVFQHHRHVSFPNDYAHIKERLESGYSTAIYWHSLMFVSISRSERAIDRVVSANRKYATINPAKVMPNMPKPKPKKGNLERFGDTDLRFITIIPKKKKKKKEKKK